MDAVTPAFRERLERLPPDRSIRVVMVLALPASDRVSEPARRDRAALAVERAARYAAVLDEIAPHLEELQCHSIGKGVGPLGAVALLATGTALLELARDPRVRSIFEDHEMRAESDRLQRHE